MFGQETFAHGAACYAMRYEERQGDTSQKTKREQARHHPRWDKRVIRSLGDEESVDPNSEWLQYDNERTPCVNGHTFMTRASGRS